MGKADMLLKKMLDLQNLTFPSMSSDVQTDVLGNLSYCNLLFYNRLR